MPAFVPPGGMPPDCARIFALAYRDARRAVGLARRAAPEGGWAAYTLGWALLRWERVPEAREQLRAAQESAADDLLRLTCETGLLLAEQLGGAGAELQERWERHAARCDEAGLALEAARARCEQIAHLNVLGRPRESLALAERVRPVLDMLGGDVDRARLLRLSAVAHTDLGDTEEAARQLERALALFEAARCPVEVARTLFERSWELQRREQLAPAIADLERALTIFRQHDLPLRVAFCEKNLGIAAYQLGRYNDSLASTCRARARFAALGREDFVASCELNLGNVAYLSGLHELALDAYRRAEKTYAHVGMRRHYLVSLRNQALALRAIDRSAEALARLDAIERELRDLGDELELAELAQHQALCLRDLGEREAAHARLAAAGAAFERLGNRAAAAECELELAWIALAAGDPDEATRRLSRAAPALADRPMYAWRIAYGLGRCAELLGEPQLALERYLAAGAVVVRLRRTLAIEHASSGIFRQAEQLYGDALRLALAREDLGALLALAEQERVLARYRRPQTPPDESAELLAELDARRDLLLARVHSADLDSIDDAMRPFLDALLRARRAAQPDDDIPDGDALAGLRHAASAAFPEGWTALVYVACGDALAALVIDEREVTLARVGDDARLRRLLELACAPRYRELTYYDLARRSGGAARPWEALAELGDLLIPPAARERLGPARRLLIVPAGPLHHLPWAALRVDERWLCERAVLQVIPSLGDWPILLGRPAGGDGALLIGCSSFGGRAPDLPGVRESLDAVAARIAGTVTRLEDDTASVRAVRELSAVGALADQWLVHVSSHAQLSAGRGLLAHIKLSDGDLLYDEVARLRLGGALVTLAACDGAAGEELAGEELLSLGRALLGAGARDVVASLWPVYDRTAAAFLGYFYDALASGADAPSSLAAAQRTCARELLETGFRGAGSPLVWASWSALGTGVIADRPAGGTTPAGDRLPTR